MISFFSSLTSSSAKNSTTDCLIGDTFQWIVIFRFIYGAIIIYSFYLFVTFDDWCGGSAEGWENKTILSHFKIIFSAVNAEKRRRNAN